MHPDPSAQLNIACDNSDFAVGGGGLQQCVDNVWQPLSFFSKKLSPAETRYSAFDYATIRHFRHNLEGRNFLPLAYVMTSTIERPSLRQTRHLAYIAEFTTNIRYVRGETNFVADALSQPSVSVIGSDSLVDYTKLSEDQALDTEFIRLHHSTSSTLNLQ